MKVNHGANLYDLSSQYGFSKEDFMDFSSNINPFGSSKLAKDYLVNNIDNISEIKINVFFLVIHFSKRSVLLPNLSFIKRINLVIGTTMYLSINLYID